MADSTITALPTVTTPLAGTEVIPVDQSGTTKKVTIAELRSSYILGSASAITTPVTPGEDVETEIGSVNLPSLSEGEALRIRACIGIQNVDNFEVYAKLDTSSTKIGMEEPFVLAGAPTECLLEAYVICGDNVDLGGWGDKNVRAREAAGTEHSSILGVTFGVNEVDTAATLKLYVKATESTPSMLISLYHYTVEVVRR